MILCKGKQKVWYTVTKKTGTYVTHHKYGSTSNTTSKTLERAVEVWVEAVLDDAALEGMIKQACKNASKKCTDGPVVVRIKDMRVIAETEKPCSQCGKLHDYGVPCDVVEFAKGVV